MLYTCLPSDRAAVQTQSARLAARVPVTIDPKTCRGAEMSTFDEWNRQALDQLGLGPEILDRDLVLGVARDVAHGVTRPAAPVATYLLGVAVGRGASAPDAAARLAKLADEWPERGPRP
jgi:hypothetical protein